MGTQFQITDTSKCKDDNCCNDKIKETILYNDAAKVYTIPKDLLFEKLPPSIVDSFLDFLNNLHLPADQLSTLLELIRNGTITIACSDNDNEDLLKQK